MFQSSARLILPVDDVDTGEAEFAGVVHYRWTRWPTAGFSSAGSNRDRAV